MMTCNSISQAQEVTKSIEDLDTLVTNEVSNKGWLNRTNPLRPVKGNPFPESWAENFKIAKAFNATVSKVKFEFIKGEAVVIAIGNEDSFNIAASILDSHSVLNFK